MHDILEREYTKLKKFYHASLYHTEIQYKYYSTQKGKRVQNCPLRSVDSGVSGILSTQISYTPNLQR